MNTQYSRDVNAQNIPLHKSTRFQNSPFYVIEETSMKISYLKIHLYFFKSLKIFYFSPKSKITRNKLIIRSINFVDSNPIRFQLNLKSFSDYRGNIISNDGATYKKMLTKEFLYLISYLVISADADDREFLLRLNSREVVDAFKTVLKSAYLRELADDFATKAADYLIKEIKNKGKEVTDIQMVKTRYRLLINVPRI